MEERNLRKERVGIVTSDKMDKTVVVSITERVKHPLYKKIVSRTKKLKAHDENNACGIGDKVRVAETRPLSKDKCWRVVEIIEKAKQDLKLPTTAAQKKLCVSESSAVLSVEAETSVTSSSHPLSPLSPVAK